METVVAQKNYTDAQQIAVSVKLKTPKITRNKAFQIVSYLNEKGEIITQLSKPVSMTMLSSLIRTEAGQIIEPQSRGKFFFYDLTPNVTVTEESEKEYEESNKKQV
jgi:hypothetical protein